MSLLDYWGKQGSSVKRRKVSGDDQKEDNVLREKSSIDRASLETDSPAIPLDGDIPADENQPPNSQTELESSLPAIETDNQTIDEYGTSHALQDEPDLRQRMQNSTWQKGKSSIYVDAFNLALETVLTEEAHLFNDVEMEVFRQWKELSYEAQYLWVGPNQCRSWSCLLIGLLDTYGFFSGKLPRGIVLTSLVIRILGIWMLRWLSSSAAAAFLCCLRPRMRIRRMLSLIRNSMANSRSPIVAN